MGTPRREISLHVEPTAAVLGRLPDAVALLGPVERERRDAFHFDGDRDDYTAAHALARVAVASLAGVSPGEVVLEQRCPDCGSDRHGKPYPVGLPDVQVSWSHTRGHVAAAAAPGPVGVDLEPLKARAGRNWDDLGEVALSPAERAAMRASADPATVFVRQWVRKECLVKVGVTDLDGLTSVDLPTSVPEGGWTWRSWRFEDFTAGGGAVLGAVVSHA